MNTSKPVDARTYGLLDEAIKLKNRREYGRSVRVLARLVKENSRCAAGWGLMGGIYLFQLRRAHDAIRCFEKAAVLSPISQQASLGLFRSLWNAGRQDAAIAEMDRFQSVAHCKDYEEISRELSARVRAEALAKPSTRAKTRKVKFPKSKQAG